MSTVRRRQAVRGVTSVPNARELTVGVAIALVQFQEPLKATQNELLFTK